MRMLLVAMVSVACTAPAAPVASPSPGASRSSVAREVERGLEPAVPKLRLPRNFLPTSYAARLAIDPARTDFEGTVAITGKVAERSSVLWLHGKQLAIKRAVATRGGARATLTVTPHGEDLLELRAQPALEAGAWTLTLDYAGAVEEVNSTGVFKQTVGGASYVYTQFEASYARRAFPCFDEPDNKVPWQLTLEVPSDLVAASNTPVVRQTALAGGRKRVEFAVTKPLPSYLIAFGVGPFDIVEAGKTKSGTPVRMLTMKGRARDAAWAAETSARLTDLLEELFGSRYPFEKLDMLAIPATASFIAMEHPGLITYGESIMLIDPERGSRARAYGWATVAAHELAHQWFGNLVTTAWWDDLWLNEGFANWVERKISARFEPGWREDVAEVQIRNQALEADSLVSARQVRQPIMGPGDILNAFDGITYDKGASVLNMFERHVGQDVFLRGVRAYLKQHAFGNATSTDLFSAISQAAGTDMNAAFSTFIEQPGAPEITATLVCERGQRPSVSLRQQRYLPAGSPAPAETRPWIVPVCVAFERGGKRAEACTLLGTETGSLPLETTSCPRWLMPNVDGRGYYRSRYTDAEVTALRDRAWPDLRPTERHAVAFDVSQAALQGRLPLPLALSFVPRLAGAGDRFSLQAALAIPFGVQRLVPDELRARYEGWMRTTFGPSARRAGLEPEPRESLDVERARNSLVGAAGLIGHDPGLVSQAVKLADRWRELPEAIRGQVVTLAAHASPAVFERLRDEVYSQPDRVRRLNILGALASTPDLERQRAALALIFDPKLDIKDTWGMLFRGHGPANRAAAQQFFRDHEQAILHRVPEANRATLAFVFTASCSAERRAEIADYVTKTFASQPGGEREVRQAIEGMDQCIARKQLLEPGIRAWLGGPAGRSAAR